MDWVKKQCDIFQCNFYWIIFSPKITLCFVVSCFTGCFYHNENFTWFKEPLTKLKTFIWPFRVSENVLSKYFREFYSFIYFWYGLYIFLVTLRVIFSQNYDDQAVWTQGTTREARPAGFSATTFNIRSSWNHQQNTYMIKSCIITD